ncbi:S53 family peptidase [Lichenicola sp.]|uniref:S53 family peptidase n=1 Tax=Lichenicola sp. TaxID=2804529 RepID=UPI003AFFDA52
MPRTIKTRLGRACLAASLALSASTAATAAFSATLAGNVANWVPTAPETGTASPGQQVSIVVHMALKNVPTLRGLATAVSTPGNAAYGHYLSQSEFRSRFAPDEADVSAVQAMLGRAGMTNITVGPLGSYVSATATVSQLGHAFAVSQKMYRYGNMTLRANKEAPTIPAELAGKIVFIEGLDDTTFLKQPQHISVTAGAQLAPASAPRPATLSGTTSLATAAVLPPPVASNTPSPYCSTYFGDANATLSTKPGPYTKTLPWLACGYNPQQIQAAYGLNPFNIGLDGRGITVAIIDAYASPTLQSDGNHYAANHHLPQLTSANFKQIIPAGIYDVSASEACGPYGWWTEESLDVAAVHGSAPGANIVYVGARDCGSTLTTALLDTIYNHRADIITNSYGNNGESVAASDVAMEDQAFMAAAVQGITMLFSSGDDGDLSQLNGVATGSWEATSPYVTGVGGTSLLLKNQYGAKSEYGWGTYRDYLADATVNSKTSITTSGLTTTTADGLTFADFSFYAGSGGGISLLEAQPAYQASVVPASLATTLNEANGYSVPLSSRRVSPDISADADPYTGYLYGETYTIAGDGHSDIGCTKESATTEYCEIAEGGTSLASPLMAGVMATVNEVHGLLARPMVGFANPWLYGSKVGKTTNSAGINQIIAPTTPTAVLRGYVTSSSLVRVVTINSVPEVITTTPFPLEVCSTAICEGIDDVFNFVTPGYNDVTGLGVPYLPRLAIP